MKVVAEIEDISPAEVKAVKGIKKGQAGGISGACSEF